MGLELLDRKLNGRKSVRRWIFVELLDIYSISISISIGSISVAISISVSIGSVSDER
jgi:hypothetical protein